MVFIGLLGQGVSFGQAYKIFTTQSAGDISLFGFMVGFTAGSCWLVYGILIHDRALVVSNAVGCVGAMLVFAGILLYG